MLQDQNEDYGTDQFELKWNLSFSGKTLFTLGIARVVYQMQFIKIIYQFYYFQRKSPRNPNKELNKRDFKSSTNIMMILPGEPNGQVND